MPETCYLRPCWEKHTLNSTLQSKGRPGSILCENPESSTLNLEELTLCKQGQQKSSMASPRKQNAGEGVVQRPLEQEDKCCFLSVSPSIQRMQRHTKHLSKDKASPNVKAARSDTVIQWASALWSQWVVQLFLHLLLTLVSTCNPHLFQLDHLCLLMQSFPVKFLAKVKRSGPRERAWWSFGRNRREVTLYVTRRFFLKVAVFLSWWYHRSSNNAVLLQCWWDALRI